MFRGERYFLAFLCGAFLLARFGPERLFFVLVVVAGCAGRHVGSGDAPLKLLQGFTQLLVLVPHPVGALLQFMQAVHELGDEAVQDIGVVPGVGIGTV